MPVRSAPDARWSGTQTKAAIVERGRSASVARVKQMRTTDANRDRLPPCFIKRAQLPV